MKYSLAYIVALLCLSCSSLWAQSDNDEIFIDPAELPYFNNGDFSEYIYKNYRWDSTMIANGKTGVLYIEFTVMKDGTLSDVKVKQGKGLSPMQDAEAIRVIQSSTGKWIPGKEYGVPYDCQMKQSFRFDENMFY